MNLVSYISKDGESFGAVRDGGVVDLADAGRSIRAVLQTGPLTNLLEAAAAREPTVSLDQVMLLQVIPDATRILCIGRNYADHAKERAAEVPENPLVFTRTTQSVVGHKQAIVKPNASDQFDWEGELAVIIGKPGRHITEDAAMSFVAGYSIFMDGSIRDFQKHSFTAGKNFDSSGAFGPWMVPAQDIEDPHALQITSKLNDEVMQDGNTRDMIFSIPQLIAYISTFTYLMPGDVIATGTPAGVGAGRTPPVWMKPGDTIEVTIEGIGTLRNPVIQETA